MRKHRNRCRFDVQIEGRRVIRSFESERRAEEALARLLSEAHRHREIRAARTRGVLTVGEVVDDYYQRRKRSLELSTQAKYDRVRIRRAVAKVKGGVVVKRPKAGEARTLVVGEVFFEWLEPFREDEGWVFRGSGPRRPELARGVDELVLRLLRGKGGRLVCAEGGLGSRLSELLGIQSGSAVLRLARFLGHRTPAITMNLYANHVVEDSQVVLGRAAAELVPGA